MKHHEDHFIYRIPLPWLEDVMKLDNQSRGQTKLLNITLAIWYLHGLRREIRISTKIREKFCISRSSLHRNLQVLEDAGLVVIKRQKGAAPVIAIGREGTCTSTKRVLREKRVEG